MRFITFLAQAGVVSEAPTWLDAFARLGVAGVLGVLLYFLLNKYVPSIEKRHKEERKEWRQERDQWRVLLQEVSKYLATSEVHHTSACERDKKIIDLLERIHEVRNS